MNDHTARLRTLLADRYGIERELGRGGRVGERIGENERAAAAYTWVAGMWRNADPELQPYVKEAREALARLTAEQK